MMEAHVTLGVKSAGLGDPEAGWVELISKETRQGTHGTLAMLVARHAEPARSEARLAVAALPPEVLARVAPWREEQLIDVVTEHRVSCRFGTEPLFPRVQETVPLPADLRGFYAAVEAAVQALSPQPCEEVDFND